MGGNINTIEKHAFAYCRAIQLIRLSKALENVGDGSFFRCESVEALFLPSTIKSIGHQAFRYCQSLRLLMLANGVNKLLILPNGVSDLHPHQTDQNEFENELYDARSSFNTRQQLIFS
eukprot:431930_1